jgi:adenylate kinase family enzyme
MPRPVIFILGGPGSGKTTECKLLESHGMVHIAAGELLRQRALVDDDEGLYIRDIMSRGELVPSSLSCRLVLESIEAIPAEQPGLVALVDGFPRSLDNWTTWLSMQRDCNIVAVISLECDEATMIARTVGASRGRIDDVPETVRARYEGHVRDTCPVIDMFESMGLVVRADSTLDPASVHAQVVEGLAKKSAHTQN